MLRSRKSRLHPLIAFVMVMFVGTPSARVAIADQLPCRQAWPLPDFRPGPVASWQPPLLTAGEGRIRFDAGGGPYRLKLLSGGGNIVGSVPNGLSLDGRDGVYVPATDGPDERVGGYKPGDKIEVSVAPDVIEYFKNGELVHVARGPASYPVSVAVCAGTVQDIERPLAFSGTWLGDPRINPLPIIPLLTAEVDKYGGDPVEFDATLTRDPDGLVDRYGWDFGDGQSAEGRITQHHYVKAGTYVVKLILSGERMEKIVRERTIVILHRDP
jgi:hypothetical protein